MEQPDNKNTKTNWFETKEYKKAAVDFRARGPLGVTAADHRAIGSTPDSLLSVNPGKTRAQLMSDADILLWLQDQHKAIEEYANSKDEFFKNLLADEKKNMTATLKYLETIGRLPKEFAHYHAK